MRRKTALLTAEPGGLGGMISSSQAVPESFSCSH